MSPLLCPISSDQEVEDKLSHQDAADEQVIDMKANAVLGEPIVGVEAITFDGRGQGALAPRPLPAPKEPTAAARERHNLTHMPYAGWCPCCVACRGPNDHHRLALKYPREQPLLVGDYAFIRNTGDDQLVCVLV